MTLNNTAPRPPTSPSLILNFWKSTCHSSAPIRPQDRRQQQQLVQVPLPHSLC
ncbi:hypothetical protein B0T17DRAFT_541299 [Bombardia bombarda]|uniref:Uncharacterized protein n=1 Tax=Bombardia bombarda TaxID=252184 RepID=A0AA40BVI2_9PEZI|nr:hypothetical protein B0T17DRAFT_541299 [Bombardia bombarda]